MRLVRICLAAVLLPALCRGNISASAVNQKLPILSEDVQVELRDGYALVSGTFTFADRGDLVARLAGKEELVELRIPVVAPRTTGSPPKADLFAMRLSVGGAEYDVMESLDRIEPVGLPPTARPVIFYQAVSKRVEAGKIAVGFRYRQPYIEGRFYYIPVLPRDWNKPADASEPRDSRLRIFIRASSGAVEVLDADSVTERDGTLIYPRHLRVITAERKNG